MDKLTLPTLLQALVDDGALTTQERDRALRAAPARARDGKPAHPITAAAQLGLARADAPDAPDTQWTAEALTVWLAKHTGKPYARIDPLKIDVAAVTSVVPYAYASRTQILPIEVTPARITVATANPLRDDWQADIAKTSGREIRTVVANPEDIDRHLLEFYTLARTVEASDREHGGGAVNSLNSLEQLIDLGSRGQLDANDRHVVNIVDWLFNYAFEQRASDIHMEPRRDMGRIRFRIDGVLHEVYQIPAQVMTAVTSRVKILGRMNVAEKRRPQDGRVKTRTPDGKEVELRLSTMPTAFGEKLVMRVFDPDILVKDYGGLGFSNDDEARWNTMIRAPHGIILVTGPTGSGKTTTLYSTLRQLASPEVNICTIEDPIELIEPSFNQMQVQTNIDVTFASGVRTVLRQDPDIIMIGEIRDLATAEIAIQAALTGHLVLATLHTNDAPSAITRLVELGVPPYLLRATLLGVMAQRLVRTLCEHCKQPVAVSDAQWDALVHETGTAAQRDKPELIREAVGCLECRETGYRGRIGLYEMMPVDAALSDRITADADLATLRSAALRTGMQTLRDSGAQAVARGVTSLQEVLRVTPSLREPALDD